jgi:DnaJ-domain-containing protein 1
MSMNSDQLKRRLRQLRRLEVTLRFGRAPAPERPTLVWDVYFSTKAADSPTVKYPLSHLLRLARDDFKAAMDDYLARIYAELAQDQGPVGQAGIKDPELLARLGLPAYAMSDEITRRFRALAKQYHPDWGGESAQFVELMALYERLMDERS